MKLLMVWASLSRGSKEVLKPSIKPYTTHHHPTIHLYPTFNFSPIYSAHYSGFHVIPWTHQAHFDLITLFSKNSPLTYLTSSLPYFWVFAQMSFPQGIILRLPNLKCQLASYKALKSPLPCFKFYFIAHGHLKSLYNFLMMIVYHLFLSSCT